MRLRSGNGSVYFIVFGLLAAALAGWWTWSAQQSARRTEAVLVAARNVPPMTAIMPGDLQLAQVPLAAVPAGAFRRQGAVVGQYLRYGLLRGQVLQRAGLAAAPAESGPADAQLTAVAAGNAQMRAVAVPLQAETGLDLPQPGDHVDLLAVLKGGASAQARLLASDVLVLDQIAIGVSPAAATPGTGPQPALEQGALVLALTVDQAEQVALAQSMGQVEALLDPLGTPRPATPAPFVAAQWFGSGGR